MPKAPSACWALQDTGRDDQLARRYAALKRRLADEHADDREAYTDGKARFIAHALGSAAGC